MSNTIDTQSLINFLLSQQNVEKTIEIKSAYNIFMNHLQIHNRPGTIKAYKADLKQILTYFEKKNIINTAQIDTKVINQYILYRKPLVKPQTINKEIISLKVMLNIMIKNNYIDKINFSFQRLKPNSKQIQSISSDDIKRIVNHFNNSKIQNKFKLIFMLILTTGVRTTECINIKNKNINLDKNIIYLEHTKNGEPRNIYIVEEIKPLLISVISKNEYLFNDNNNVQMTDNSLRLFFKHLKHDLNIETLSPHKLRHYYATYLYNNSLDIYLVKDLLGHKSIQTTQIYLDIDNKTNQTKNSYYSPIKSLDPLSI